MEKKTASAIAKQYGLKSLAEMARITETSSNGLIHMNKHKHNKFVCLVMGAVQFKSRLEIKDRKPTSLQNSILTTQGDESIQAMRDYVMIDSTSVEINFSANEATRKWAESFPMNFIYEPYLSQFYEPKLSQFKEAPNGTITFTPKKCYRS